MTKTYTRTAIRLHWIIAILIFMLLCGGFIMGNIPNDVAFKGTAYMMHKSIGITVLVLSLLRLVWRLMHKPPALDADITGISRIIPKAIHALFYAFMIVMPLVGWAVVSTSKWAKGSTALFGFIPWPDLPFWAGMDKVAKKQIHGVFEETHEVLAFIAIALIVLHILAALKHHKDGRDVLVRMMPSLRKKI